MSILYMLVTHSVVHDSLVNLVRRVCCLLDLQLLQQLRPVGAVVVRRGLRMLQEGRLGFRLLGLHIIMVKRHGLVLRHSSRRRAVHGRRQGHVEQLVLD